MEVPKIDFDAFIKFQEATRQQAQNGHHAQHHAAVIPPSLPPSSLPLAVSPPSLPHAAGTMGHALPTALHHAHASQHGLTYIYRAPGMAVASSEHTSQGNNYIAHAGTAAANGTQSSAEINTSSSSEANQNGRGANYLQTGGLSHISRESYNPPFGALPHTAQESALMTRREVIPIASTPGG
uniref:Uncharacterized protein n=1 Tax=Chromera velia CCMP2878 TaxID=1169474 RepID=A0A0G4HAN1_9ALVE|eukprot:Cvel_25759.t1-p1 / transcript=Cvel_25759.t1 / gene=Cvel_25759 / organism=Chromera_velia_CCMP2878 / gene_product=hypothetical protein / transcript_product=hypothetical protein / location=Cvel_scaffold2966:17435-17977(+) / protein_length=181 / sequence_SO=supercontig / SO=protein_coding / is_pseudo=false